MTAFPIRRLATGALGAIVLLTPVVWTLSKRIPDTRETPLVSDLSSRSLVPIELSYLDYPGSAGRHTAKMRLSLGNAEALLRHDAIQIATATFETAPGLESAEIVVSGTECVYRSRRGALYGNNATLTFDRGSRCYPVRGMPSGELVLTIAFSGPGRVALWTYRAKGERDPNLIYLPDPVWSDLGLRVELQGRYLDSLGFSRYRRVDLLNYMWQVSDRSAWIWWILGISGALQVIGGLAFWRPGAADRGRAREALIRASGALCLSASLGLLYAVLTPPFQAPDEPHHFVGFGSAAARPEVADGARDWASLGHFERIHFHADERFRPGDVGRPGAAWRGIAAPGITRGTAIPYWKAVAPLLQSLPVPRTFMALRLLNVLVLGLAVAGLVAVLVLAGGASSGHLIAAPLFFVPALPFFAMHVSNYPLLIAAVVAIAGGAVLLFLDVRQPAVAGALIGGGYAVAILISRAAVPLAPFIAALLAMRLLLGSQPARLWSSAAFWIGALVPPILALLSAETEYVYWMLAAPNVAHLDADAVLIALRAWGWVLLSAVPAAVAAERVAGGVVSRAGESARGMVRGAVSRGALIVAAAVFLLLAASLWVPLPQLPLIAHAPQATPSSYAGEALQTGLTILRLRNPDYLTSVTFWGGFGWLETLPDSRVISLLCGLTGLALIVLLVDIGRTRDVRKGLWLAAALAGYAASISLYAFVLNRAASADLHGRYLVGLYLSMLLICWSPTGSMRPSAGHARLASLAGLLCVALHAYCLSFIVSRYF